MVGFQIGWIVMTMCVCALSCVQLFVTPWTVACQALAWNFPGKNTGAGCHFLLQGIFPTQELNLHLFVSPPLVISFFTTAPPGKSSFFHRYSTLSIFFMLKKPGEKRCQKHGQDLTSVQFSSVAQSCPTLRPHES